MDAMRNDDNPFPPRADWEEPARQLWAKAEAMFRAQEAERWLRQLHRDWPEFVGPIPATAEAEIDLGREPFLVPKGTMLYATGLAGAPVIGWRTGADLPVMPLRVRQAEVTRQIPPGALPPEMYGLTRAIHVVLEVNPDAQPPGEWSLADRLTLSLDGREEDTWPLYQRLAWGLAAAAARGDRSGEWVPLQVRPLGLLPEEELIPSPTELPAGSRLLTEFFVCPRLSFGLEGVAAALKDTRQQVQILFVLREARGAAPGEIDPQTFRLNRVPVVNLTERAQRVELLQGREEYELTADPTEPGGAVFGMVGVDLEGEPTVGAVLHRPRPGEPMTDVVLSWSGKARSGASAPAVRLECFQAAAQTLATGARLQTEDGTRTGRLASRPNPSIRADRVPGSEAPEWDLIRLPAGRTPVGPFRELLRWYALLPATVSVDGRDRERKRAARAEGILRAIRGLATRPDDRELPPRNGRPGGPCRGREVRLALDLDELPGRAAGPLGVVLEQYLANHTPACEFSRLIVTMPDDEEVHACLPRFGHRR